MPIQITFRLGSVIPTDEYLDVGEPVFDPEKLRLGLGAGNSQPLWYPGIDPLSQDLIMHGNSLIRSEVGGAPARFGFDAPNRFMIYTFSGVRVRITDFASVFYNRVNLLNGGSFSGDVDTAGGRFTDMNVQKITTSATQGHTKVVDGVSGDQVGRIDERGITSLAQQETYLAMAMAAESWSAFIRNTFSSGMVSVRHYVSSRPFSPRHKTTLAAFSAMSIHNHMDWRGLCGLAEISVVINGHHIQTRHNDYRTMRPINTAVFGERSLNTGAPVAQSVRNLPLGYTGLTLNNDLTGTQVKWMRDVYTNSPDHCIYELAYLEMWVQKFDGSLIDIATSTRHSNEGRVAKAFLEQIKNYTASGLKPPTENLPSLPGIVLTHDANGQPTLGYLNWRISTLPVANLSNRNVSITIDGIGYDLRALPFDPAKAGAGIIDATNRFTVRRKLAQKAFKNTRGRNIGAYGAPRDPKEDFAEIADQQTWQELIFSSNSTMFDCADLEELCCMVPGFDGVNNYNTQFVNDPHNRMIPGSKIPVRYSSTTDRGLGYYSNSYSVNTLDAAGFNSAFRGFGDTNLFTAKTRHPEVLNGWSFMIPLELVVRTPRENWNPFGIVNQATPTGNGRYATPYSGWNDYGVFMTLPKDALTIVNTVDTQADTMTGAWVTTPSGAKEMLSSGIRIFDYTGERRRFPVVPESIQFTGLGRDMEFLKDTMKNLLKRVAAGNITSAEIDEAF